MTYPHNVRHRVYGGTPVFVIALALVGCDARYENAANTFPYVDGARLNVSVERVSFLSPSMPGIFHVGGGMLNVQIGVNDISLRPPLLLRFAGPSTTIPASKVASCSKACFGPGEEDVDLIVPSANVVVSFLNAESVADWCWSNRVPIVGRRDRDKWQYRSQPLPEGKVFDSESAYKQRLDETCHAGT